MFNMNSGYDGYRMSNRAVTAYDYGEMPLSKWTKKEIINRINYFADDLEVNIDTSNLEKCKKDVLKDYFLYNSSWHHTGKYCNKTEFYDVDDDKVETLTEEIINNLVSKSKSKPKENKKTEKVTAPTKYYKVEYLDWYQRGKCNQVIDFGEVEGIWFYPTDGGKKKIDANGFRLIEEISKRSVTINRKKVNELKKAFKYQSKYRNLDKFLYRALTDEISKTFVKDLKALRKKCIEVKRENLRKGWEMTNPELLERLENENYIESKISKDFINKVKESI